MARTNAQAVQGILLKDYDNVDKPSLSPFIDTASSIVDDLVSAAGDRGITVSAAKAELIERWLAAHCYVQSDQTFAEKETERASAAYHGVTGMRLESSKYGQTALAIDTSGILNSLSSGMTVRALWLGKPPSQQVPYHNRD